MSCCDNEKARSSACRRNCLRRSSRDLGNDAGMVWGSGCSRDLFANRNRRRVVYSAIWQRYDSALGFSQVRSLFPRHPADGNGSVERAALAPFVSMKRPGTATRRGGGM